MAELNQTRTQAHLGESTRKLASGLRIQSASDDPSGLAIAESLRAAALGLQQGQRNVQDANNALSIADGALASVTSILQRIRTLVVRATSDITAGSDLKNIQTEIGELLREINSISQKTEFNGRPLLDGSASSAALVPASVRQVPGIPLTDGGTINSTVVNADGLGNPGQLVTNATVGSLTNQPPLYALFQVLSYDPVNVTDPIAGPQGPGFYVRTVAYSGDPVFGPQQDAIQALPSGGLLPASGQITFPGGAGVALSYVQSNLTPADVGTVIAFVVDPGKPAGTGQAIGVQEGPKEGDRVSIDIPSVSTQSLGISFISVLAPQVVDAVGNVSQDSSNSFAALDSLYRADAAIDSVSGSRAILGAQIVALNEQAQDGAIQQVALEASESNIRDLDVAAEVTAFTKDSILNTIQTSVIARFNELSSQVVNLVRPNG